MRWTANLTNFSLDLGSYKRALHAEMTKAVQEAARQYLRATVASLIPVWSGASAATFIELAQKVAYPLGVRPKRGVKNRVALGQHLGQGEVEYGPTRYVFKYSTSLPHLIWNESHNANVDPDPGLYSKLTNPGPYHFQRAGQAAFLQYASGVRLPNPFAYLRTRGIKVS